MRSCTVRLNEMRVWRKGAHPCLHDPGVQSVRVRSAASARVISEKKSNLVSICGFEADNSSGDGAAGNDHRCSA
jgi:hypothetical protein